MLKIGIKLNLIQQFDLYSFKIIIINKIKAFILTMMIGLYAKNQIH